MITFNNPPPVAPQPPPEYSIGKSGLNIPRRKVEPAKEAPKPQDTSVFGGKPSISRGALARKLKTEMWEVSKSAGLHLDASGRAGLVDDIPEIYGSKISKADLKGTIRKLRQKAANAPINEGVELRKEANLFKKIGGIK